MDNMSSDPCTPPAPAPPLYPPSESAAGALTTSATASVPPLIVSAAASSSSPAACNSHMAMPPPVAAAPPAPIPSPSAHVPYYLKSIMLVIDAALEHDSHLFLPEDLALIEQLRGCTLNAQRLFARMFFRRGPWFPVRRLQASYSSEFDVTAALRELSQRGLLQDGESVLLPLAVASSSAGTASAGGGGVGPALVGARDPTAVPSRAATQRAAFQSLFGVAAVRQISVDDMFATLIAAASDSVASASASAPVAVAAAAAATAAPVTAPPPTALATDGSSPPVTGRKRKSAPAPVTPAATGTRSAPASLARCGVRSAAQDPKPPAKPVVIFLDSSSDSSGSDVVPAPVVSRRKTVPAEPMLVGSDDSGAEAGQAPGPGAAAAAAATNVQMNKDGDGAMQATPSARSSERGRKRKAPLAAAHSAAGTRPRRAQSAGTAAAARPAASAAIGHRARGRKAAAAAAASAAAAERPADRETEPPASSSEHAATVGLAPAGTATAADTAAVVADGARGGHTSEPAAPAGSSDELEAPTARSRPRSQATPRRVRAKRARAVPASEQAPALADPAAPAAEVVTATAAAVQVVTVSAGDATADGDEELVMASVRVVRTTVRQTLSRQVSQVTPPARAEAAAATAAAAAAAPNGGADSAPAPSPRTHSSASSTPRSVGSRTSSSSSSSRHNGQPVVEDEPIDPERALAAPAVAAPAVLESLLDALSAYELRAVANRVGARTGTRREDCIQQLVAQTVLGTAQLNRRRLDVLLSAVRHTCGTLVRLLPALCRVLALVQRVFFLVEYTIDNGADKRAGAPPAGGALRAALLGDIARLKFAPYTVRVERPVWPDRVALGRYEAALQLGAAFEEALLGDGTLAQLTLLLRRAVQRLQNEPPDPRDASDPLHVVFSRFTAAHVYARIVSHGVGVLERARDYRGAVDVLRRLLAQPRLPHKHGQWYDRLTINLCHLKKSAEAIKMCQRALEDPHVREGPRLTLQRRLARLSKQQERAAAQLAAAVARARKGAAATIRARAGRQSLRKQRAAATAAAGVKKGAARKNKAPTTDPAGPTAPAAESGTGPDAVVVSGSDSAEDPHPDGDNAGAVCHEAVAKAAEMSSDDDLDAVPLSGRRNAAQTRAGDAAARRERTVPARGSVARRKPGQKRGAVRKRRAWDSSSCSTEAEDVDSASDASDEAARGKKSAAAVPIAAAATAAASADGNPPTAKAPPAQRSKKVSAKRKPAVTRQRQQTAGPIRAATAAQDELAEQKTAKSGEADAEPAGDVDHVEEEAGQDAAAVAASPIAVPERYIEALLLKKATAQRSVFEGVDGPCSVETLCLQYYRQSGGWEGIHCESSGLCTLFGLLMWDVIFADVPDVFRSRYQAGPLDLNTDAFYVLRRTAVDTRVAEIAAASDVGLLVADVYVRHRDELCPGVHWDLLPLDTLVAVARGLGARVLSVVCAQLARDFKHWARGLPDLLLWHADGRTKLVEVKGPRDRLSDIQRAWLASLLAAGGDVEVCHVKESEARPEWLAQLAQMRRAAGVVAGTGAAAAAAPAAACVATVPVAVDPSTALSESLDPYAALTRAAASADADDELVNVAAALFGDGDESQAGTDAVVRNGEDGD